MYEGHAALQAESLMLLQCGAFWFLCFWLISEAQHHFQFAPHRPRASSSSKCGSSRELERAEGPSAAETPVSKGEHINLPAGMPTSFMATSWALKNHSQGEAVGICLPGAILALLRWTPLPTHTSFPGKLGKERGQREIFQRASFCLCWCIREMMKMFC